VKEIKVVCIFGISGVGKTTLIRKALESVSGWRHLQASELIKIGLANKATSSEILRRSTKERMVTHQLILLENFWSYVRSLEDANAILDGHLVIDAEQGYVKVPVWVINRLRPTKLVHIEDKPEEIYIRRQVDIARIRPTRTPEKLDSYQKLSADLCLRYGRELNVPVNRLNPSNPRALIKLLNAL
jgi:adenylate kinase